MNYQKITPISGVLVKMDDVEAGIKKSNKEKENVKEIK